MTTAPTETPTTELFDVDLSPDTLHLECCRAEPPMLICRVPHHPELVADPDQPEQMNCPECLRLTLRVQCSKAHTHCPLAPLSLCPPRPSQPS